MSLSVKLTELMRDRGLNRAELSKGSGVPYTTIVAIFENGGENTKLSTLKKLASFFEITLDDLAAEDNGEIETIAAHHDGDDWTEEELQDIEEFKEILRLKRQLRNRE